MNVSRLSFLLCLLAALHTSCSNASDRLALDLSDELTRPRSASAPAEVSKEQESPKEGLCKLLLANLAYRGGNRRIYYDMDPYDQETFKQQIKEEIIEVDASAEGFQYQYIHQRVPILVVATHYSLDKFLVSHLLNKDAHKSLTHEEIERCLITAANNAAPMPQKKVILKLLIKHFDSSSSYFQGGPSSLDSLLFKCNPENLLVLIDSLSEQGIDIYALDWVGNTLLHRACWLRAKDTYNIDVRRLPDLLEQLLQRNKFKSNIEAKNIANITPLELLQSRVELIKQNKPWYYENKIKAGEKALELLRDAREA